MATKKNATTAASYFGTMVYLRDFDPNETYNYIPNSYIPIVIYKGQAYIAEDTPDGLTPDISKTWRATSTGGSGDIKANMPLRVNTKGEIEIILDEDYITRYKPQANKFKGHTFTAFGGKGKFYFKDNGDLPEGALTIQGTFFLDELVDMFNSINEMFENVTKSIDQVTITANSAKNTADAANTASASAKKVADTAVQTITPTDTDSVKFTVKKVGTDIQISATASGSGDNSKVIVKVSDSSATNEINYIERDGYMTTPSGLVCDFATKSILTVKTITSCFRTTWERTDARTVTQAVATLNNDGTIYGWRQSNTKNNITQIQTPYAHKVDNLKSFDLATRWDDMFYTYVDPATGFLTLVRLALQADKSVTPMVYTSAIKPTDHNTIILADYGNASMVNMVWVGYWSATGFQATSFGFVTWGFTNINKTIKTVNNGKGKVKAALKPKTGIFYMWFEQSPNNMLIAYTNAQAISSKDKTNIINKFTIGDIAYDVDTDLLFIFYFYGEDTLTDNLPSQPFVAGYRIDRVGNFYEVVPWSILPGRAFPKTSSGGSVSLGVVNEAGTGQIVFAYRDCNGQGKGVTFIIRDNKVIVTDSLIITSGGGTGYYLSKDNCGQIVPAGSRHVCITYFQSDTTECVPMVELYFITNIGNKIAGVGSDNKGNIIVTGVWTTGRTDLIIGATYYIASKGAGKREYLLTTDVTSGAMVGIAVSAKAILIK